MILNENVHHETPRNSMKRLAKLFSRDKYGCYSNGLQQIANIMQTLECKVSNFTFWHVWRPGNDSRVFAL